MKNNIYKAIFLLLILLLVHAEEKNLISNNMWVIINVLIIGIIIYKCFFRGKIKNNKSKNLLENTPIEFEKIYQDLYINNIKNLERIRNRVRNKIIFIWIGLAIMIISLIKQDVLLMPIGFVILIFTSSNDVDERSYKLTYKIDIIRKFIKLVSTKLEYKTTNFDSDIVMGNYSRANFDNEVFNEFSIDDYIAGEIEDNVFLELSDLNVERHLVYENTKQIIKLFKGIFAQTECDKDIGTYIKISKNQLKILGQQDRVEMDSQEFEKYFDIYSENKILTMQILTSDVMLILTDFYNRYNIEYEVVIRNNKLYIRFFTGPMFEPKVFGNSMDKELLLSYYCILNFIVDVTKEVNKALKGVEI